MSKPTNNKSSISTIVQHHYVRTILSSFFGFIALSLIISSILVIWLNRTLTNTTQYVAVVAPLVSNPDVQTFVATKAADAILGGSDAPVQDISTQLLGAGQVVGKTNAQLTDQVRPLVEQNVRSVVGSPAFAVLWKSTNQQIHSQLIAQLGSKSQTLTLNFHPLVVGTVNLLATTKLGVTPDKLQIPDNIGVVTLKGDQLRTMRKAYGYFKEVAYVTVGATIVALLLAILLSVHHLKTVRRIALATGIMTAILAILLSVPSFIKAQGADVVQQKMAIALVNAITHELRVSLIIVSIVCFAMVIGTKVYSVVVARRAALPNVNKMGS